MNTEQQIRLNFLDEAEEYFDKMESNLLGLANTQIEAQQIDLILRSAHSIKGGAAMMGFNELSQIAHRLEDFFKILRVRYISQYITANVETLLLQGVDCLRYVSELNRQGREITQFSIEERSHQIFEQLQQHLGDLEEADEDVLMSQDEDVDPALLIFEEGVNTVLDRFEEQLEKSSIQQLAQELTSTTEELIGFGYMASLEPFIQLCQSIQEQVVTLSSQEIGLLADEALKTWRRSHALVSRGSLEKLPFRLETSRENSFDEQLQENNLDLTGLQSAFESNLGTEEENDFDSLVENTLDLTGLQLAFATEKTTIANTLNNKNYLNNSTKLSVEKMVRVSASQLRQFNNLFEQLILDRNTINLQLQQFKNIITLMSQRMAQMERSNIQLKQWYDRASIEGLLNVTEPLLSTPTNSTHSEQNSLLQSKQKERFDTLEMDRYSDVHLICQEQIETIVQLQEIATDIELELQEITQAVRNLNYTTKSMQGNVTRTQMLPFAEVVKRFPRVIRDLNLQFNKQVELKIIGENTLLDRSVVEALSDPLMHLLRNSFDHGIEDTKTRIAAGKSPSGTITIEATNQGTYTVINLSDDGRGISLQKIRDRVMEMGISQSEVGQIQETDLINFIFEPGFSTAQKVTEISGRGVGMDVVRTNLEEMQGDVQVKTELGLGTTFTLKIPFSLSILKVAVIEQAGIIFAISASCIQELLPLDLDNVITTKDHQFIHWNQQEIPLVQVETALVYQRHNTLSLSGTPAIDRTMALIVGDGKIFVALQLSRFWYEQESTIRPIESLIALPPGVISSVIFGDGKVIPLIEPLLLAEKCLELQLKGDREQENTIDTKTKSISTTILVVDDSINVRRYLSLTLEKAGYLVEQARDGQEAVEKLLSGLVVNGIICDIEMPRLDGYGVLEEIKGRAEFAHLPVAMLTSRSNEKHRKLAMNLGASAYFSKPYNEQELLERLAELLAENIN